MVKRYRVDSKQLKAGAKIEAKEHHVGERTARRIARQHLERHPSFYKLEPVFDRMMERDERNIKPIKRKRPDTRAPWDRLYDPFSRM
jgi:hypothetical protein